MRTRVKPDPNEKRVRLGQPRTDALYFALKDKFPRSDFESGPVFVEVWALCATLEGELRNARKVHSSVPDIVRIARAVARPLGYSIAVHGSLSRDLDLVATPWSEHACNARTLAWNVMQALNGFVIVQPGVEPSRKPHGRLAWSIHTPKGFYVDLSVAPRAYHSAAERVSASVGRRLYALRQRQWFWGQPWWSKAWNRLQGRRRSGSAAADDKETD